MYFGLAVWSSYVLCVSNKVHDFFWDRLNNYRQSINAIIKFIV